MMKQTQAKIISILTTTSLLMSITQAHIPSSKVKSNDDLTLNTGTLTYSDIENKTEYSNIGFGSSGLDSPMAGDKQTQTNTAISSTITVDIKDKAKQTQDISKISNDTEHAHYRVQEVNKEVLNIRKDVAGQIGKEAFKAIGDIYDNEELAKKLPPKTLIHGLMGGIMSKIAGGEFKSGATGAVVSHEAAKMVENSLREKYNNGDITKQQLENAMEVSTLLANIALSNISNSSDTQTLDAIAVGDSVVDNNAKKHISRNLDIKIPRTDINIGGVAQHRANVISRDNIEDYSQEMRDKLGEPQLIDGKYVYILEDLQLKDKDNVNRLHPVVNAQASTNAYKKGDYTAYQEFPDDFEKENKLLYDYIKDISKDRSESPKYPTTTETLLCLFNYCSDSFYNSNTAADTRDEKNGFQAPDTGDKNVPGGLHDREGAKDDKESEVDILFRDVPHTIPRKNWNNSSHIPGYQENIPGYSK